MKHATALEQIARTKVSSTWSTGTKNTDRFLIDVDTRVHASDEVATAGNDDVSRRIALERGNVLPTT